MITIIIKMIIWYVVINLLLHYLCEILYFFHIYLYLCYQAMLLSWGYFIWNNVLEIEMSKNIHLNTRTVL